MLLALDTATSATTVALLDVGDGAVLAERLVVDARRTTELLAPLVAEVLAAAGATPADVSLVAVGTGPGPFTSLRVGMVTGATLAHARGVPVLGVCSLDALAHEWSTGADRVPGERVAVATDARRKEVYLATYERCDGDCGLPWRRLTGPDVLRPSEVPASARALPTLGRGPGLYPDDLGEPVGASDVRAAALGAVALARHRAGTAQPVEPLYLRRPDAVAPGAPKSALAPHPAQRSRRAPRQQEQPALGSCGDAQGQAEQQ